MKEISKEGLATPVSLTAPNNKTYMKTMVAQAMKQKAFMYIKYSFRWKKNKREKFWGIMDEIIL